MTDYVYVALVGSLYRVIKASDNHVVTVFTEERPAVLFSAGWNYAIDDIECDDD